jgi:hypothetical protein
VICITLALSVGYNLLSATALKKLKQQSLSDFFPIEQRAMCQLTESNGKKMLVHFLLGFQIAPRLMSEGAT